MAWALGPSRPGYYFWSVKCISLPPRLRPLQLLLLRPCLPRCPSQMGHGNHVGTRNSGVGLGHGLTAFVSSAGREALVQTLGVLENKTWEVFRVRQGADRVLERVLCVCLVRRVWVSRPPLLSPPLCLPDLDLEALSTSTAGAFCSCVKQP